jgi:hypothetical protein
MSARLACQLPLLETPLEDKLPPPERVAPNVPLLAGPLREKPPPPLPPPRCASRSAAANTNTTNGTLHAIRRIHVMDIMAALLSFLSVLSPRAEPAFGP